VPALARSRTGAKGHTQRRAPAAKGRRRHRTVALSVRSSRQPLRRHSRSCLSYLPSHRLRP
jgi:hypothetical protein